MRIERNRDISFKKIIIDKKGRGVLKGLIFNTSEEALPDVTKMLKRFKAQLDEFSTTLEQHSQTKGTDILLSSKITETSKGKHMPVLLLKKDQYVYQQLNLLELNYKRRRDKNILPAKLSSTIIQFRSKRLAETMTAWINGILRQNFQKKQTPSEIVKDIFG